MNLKNNNADLASLTGIRAYAALVVLFYHYRDFIVYPSFIDVVAKQGRAGVSLFFILSGFILTYKYFYTFNVINKNLYKDYIFARFSRIYPVFLFSIIVITPIVLHYKNIPGNLYYNIENRKIVISWILNVFLINIYTYQDYIVNMWNGPSWSICVEMFFYVFFPFIIRKIISRMYNIKAAMKYILVIYIFDVLLFVSIAYITWKYIPYKFGLYWEWILYKMPFLRINEFIVGCLLGYIFLNTEKLEDIFYYKFLSRNVLINAVLFITLIITIIPNSDNSIGTAIVWLKYYILYIPVFLLIIIILAYDNSSKYNLFNNRFIVKIGKASYSLYIIHWIPYTILINQKRMNIIYKPLVYYTIMLSTVILSLMIHNVIENPARNIIYKYKK